WIWLELGQVARAREIAEEGAEVGGDMEEPYANSLLIQADACLRLGDPDRAAGLLAQSRPIGLGAAYGWRFELRALEPGARPERARERDVRQHANQLAVLARDREIGRASWRDRV